jgi:hypothetical protein
MVNAMTATCYQSDKSKHFSLQSLVTNLVPYPRINTLVPYLHRESIHSDDDEIEPFQKTCRPEAAMAFNSSGDYGLYHSRKSSGLFSRGLMANYNWSNVDRITND